MGYTVSRIFTILSAFDSWFMEPWVDTGISAKRTSQKARNLGKLGFGLKELVSIPGSLNGCLQSETVQSVYMHRLPKQSFRRVHFQCLHRVQFYLPRVSCFCLFTCHCSFSEGQSDFRGSFSPMKPANAISEIPAVLPDLLMRNKWSRFVITTICQY